MFFGTHIRETMCMAPRMIAASRPAFVSRADADTNNALLACVDKPGMAGVRMRHGFIIATHNSHGNTASNSIAATCECSLLRCLLATHPWFGAPAEGEKFGLVRGVGFEL